jgi:hypothetical protein
MAKPTKDSEFGDVIYQFADRFTLQRSWSLAAQLVARHPGLDLRVDCVQGGDGHQLLLVGRPPTGEANQYRRAGQRVQFDLPGGAAWVARDGAVLRLSWLDVFAAGPPRQVVEYLEREGGFGAGDPDGATMRSWVYRVIGQILARHLDDAATWQALSPGFTAGPTGEDVDAVAALYSPFLRADAQPGETLPPLGRALKDLACFQGRGRRDGEPQVPEDRTLGDQLRDGAMGRINLDDLAGVVEGFTIDELTAAIKAWERRPVATAAGHCGADGRTGSAARDRTLRSVENGEPPRIAVRVSGWVVCRDLQPVAVLDDENGMVYLPGGAAISGRSLTGSSGDDERWASPVELAAAVLAGPPEEAAERFARLYPGLIARAALFHREVSMP